MTERTKRDDGTTIYRDGEGRLHRDDGPSVEESTGLRAWFRHGQLHRLDGPAVLWPTGVKQWFRDGRLHRDDGPAVEFPDGSSRWYLNGVRTAKSERP